MNESFDLIYRSLPLLSKGVLLTLQVMGVSALISLTLGSLIGVLTCQRLRVRWLSPFLEAVTFVLRAVPFYVQLLIAYFVLPDLLTLELSAFSASVISLGLCSSAYMTQLVRCGIDSIPKLQWEAAFTLGYSTWQSLRYIILPQTVRNVLPALTNEMDSLLKSTSILASIGLLELTRMGMNIVSREMEPLTVYLAVALFYICISGIINIFSKWLEARLRYA